jgi:putative Mg2+ transporter-C (MgtC) family protein
MDMPLHPSWFDIAIPLTLTMLAGATIGFNRGAVGTRPGSEQLFWSAWQLARHDTDQHSAAPRRQDVPIICGHGYDAPSAGYSDSRWIYGGGAILRGRSHHGVTTAATLWLVTVIGLVWAVANPSWALSRRCLPRSRSWR